MKDVEVVRRTTMHASILMLPVYYQYRTSSDVGLRVAAYLLCCGECSEAKDRVEQLSKDNECIVLLFCCRVLWL